MKTGAPLDALRNYVSTLSDLPRTVIVDALCSCLLQVGEKSFSSLQTNLINYLPLFKEVHNLFVDLSLGMSNLPSF